MNIEQKLHRFQDFWNNKPVSSPLIGFDVGGWFPFQRFSALKELPEDGYLDPDSLDPLKCLQDYKQYLSRLLELPDDLMKGIAPIPAVPWMEGMLGCKIKRKGDSLWAEESKLDYSKLQTFDTFSNSPWYRVYLRFVETLAKAWNGEYPVGLPILRGVSDLLGALRGHTEAILDAVENPNRVKHTARKLARVIIQVTRAHHRCAGMFQGGYTIEQYGIWAPGPLVRMQEDASALYSPELFRTCILPADRIIAQAFPYSLIHLHGSSLFLLEEFLSVKEIGVFQVNRDVGEMDLKEMKPFLAQIQNRGRRLLLRGTFTEQDYQWIRQHLSPVGLVVQTVVNSLEQAQELIQAASRIFRNS